MTNRYESDHDGTSAYVFDTETKLRAYFPDSASAYKAAQWLNTGITSAKAAERYHWQAGKNSIYVDLQTGSWGNATDVVTLELTDDEFDLLDGMDEGALIEWAHSRHHEQQEREG